MAYTHIDVLILDILKEILKEYGEIMRLRTMTATQSNACDYGNIPKIKNGSMFSIGCKIGKTQLKVDQHFNWFQKLMWKWCFGVKVEDYSEE